MSIALDVIDGPQEATRLAPRRSASRIPRAGGPNMLLVANANASGLGGKRELVTQAASLLKAFGALVDTRLTSSTDELDELVSEEERRIVLMGGDGTMHAIANVAGHTPELAVLPRGRANNIARALGIPLGLGDAARLAVEGAAAPLDGIAVETADRTMVAIEGVSVGFHAQARARYHASNSGDTSAGVSAALGALVRFDPVTVALEIDGELSAERVGQIFIANFPFFGPRLAVAPEARPSDGLLEVVEIDVRRRFSIAVELAELRRGKHPGRHVSIRPARHVRIATAGRSPIVADTTVLCSGPFDLSVRPRMINVVGGTA